MDQNVGFSIRIIRAHELVAQAQRAAEIGCPRFFRKKGVGPSLNHAAFNLFSAQHAAESRRGFVKYILERGSGAAMLFESKSRGQPRNSAANDSDALHESRPQVA